MTEQTAVRIAAFNNLKDIGRKTADAIHQIVVDSPVPLTINEINALFKEKTGRPMSREYMRARLEQLEAVGKITSRTETLDEVSLRSDARGGAARLFYTEHTPQSVRTQLPNVPQAALRSVRQHNRKKQQRRAKKAATSNYTTDSLAKALDVLYGDRTAALQARIKELEARLSQIARLAK